MTSLLEQLTSDLLDGAKRFYNAQPFKDLTNALTWTSSIVIVTIVIVKSLNNTLNWIDIAYLIVAATFIAQEATISRLRKKLPPTDPDYNE